jgi:hypothetical protein
MVAAGAEMCAEVYRNIVGSKPTLECIRRATRAGIPTCLVESEAVTPRRLLASDLRAVYDPKKGHGHDPEGRFNSGLANEAKCAARRLIRATYPPRWGIIQSDGTSA